MPVTIGELEIVPAEPAPEVGPETASDAAAAAPSLEEEVERVMLLERRRAARLRAN